MMADGLRALSVKAISFGGIGVLNTGIHAGIVVLLVETLAVWPPVGHVFGFVAASLFSYFANATITFRMPMSLAGYLKFVSVSLATLVTAVVISTIVQMLALSYLLGIALVIVINPAISFALHHRITFRKV
jgi:putative flippase GtrA